MSDERPRSLREQAELQRMLRGLSQLGQSTLSPHTPAEDLSREARMAARIDEQVAELTARRQSSRRWGLSLMAAAAIVLSFGGMRYLHFESGQLTIEQEPVAAGKAAKETPAPSAAPAEQPAVTPRRVVAPTARASTGPSQPNAPPSAAPVEAGSTLAQENRLFKEAAEASRTGDVGGALAQLDKLLTSYPASPLAQGALVRKFRLLASAGRTDEARREAERYLASYPTGFAVGEAEALKKNDAAATPPASLGEPESP